MFPSRGHRVLPWQVLAVFFIAAADDASFYEVLAKAADFGELDVDDQAIAVNGGAPRGGTPGSGLLRREESKAGAATDASAAGDMADRPIRRGTGSVRYAPVSRRGGDALEDHRFSIRRPQQRHAASVGGESRRPWAKMAEVANDAEGASIAQQTEQRQPEGEDEIAAPVQRLVGNDAESASISKQTEQRQPEGEEEIAAPVQRLVGNDAESASIAQQTEQRQPEGEGEIATPVQALPKDSTNSTATLAAPGTVEGADVVIVGNESADEYRPTWARQQQLMAGPDRLPWQPSNCTYHLDSETGDSDHGGEPHPLCEACRAGCSYSNSQAPLVTKWQFSPTLQKQPALDIIMMLEFPNVEQISPFSENGIFHKMNFEVSRMKGPGFRGTMGPQIRGGVGPGEALHGMHTLMVRDTRLPSADGMLVKGRWLALVGSKNPGDIGTCKRTCVDCSDYPEIQSSGMATGVMCTLDVGVMNGESFVYQLRQTKGVQNTEYQGVSYSGAEWVVGIRDTSTGANYEVGRVVLEGAAAFDGVTDFSSQHEHLGCSPCDAYFQAARVTGPFIVAPGMHQITRAEAGPAKKRDQKQDKHCDLHRVVALGGYTLLYESGPGVWPASPTKDMAAVYSCEYIEGLMYAADNAGGPPVTPQLPPPS